MGITRGPGTTRRHTRSACPQEIHAGDQGTDGRRNAPHRSDDDGGGPGSGAVAHTFPGPYASSRFFVSRIAATCSVKKGAKTSLLCLTWPMKKVRAWQKMEDAPPEQGGSAQTLGGAERGRVLCCAVLCVVPTRRESAAGRGARGCWGLWVSCWDAAAGHS